MHWESNESKEDTWQKLRRLELVYFVGAGDQNLVWGVEVEWLWNTTSDWQMQADLHNRKQFLQELAATHQKPDFIMEASFSYST